MITKYPSRKSVIIPMNLENSNNFMKNSSFHVSNINKALKNIKSDIMVNFIRADNIGVVIITNKVVRSLDLQTIKKYVKNMNNIEVNQIELPRLS